jgi:hypothetical protein
MKVTAPIFGLPADFEISFEEKLEQLTNVDKSWHFIRFSITGSRENISHLLELSFTEPRRTIISALRSDLRSDAALAAKLGPRPEGKLCTEAHKVGSVLAGHVVREAYKKYVPDKVSLDIPRVFRATSRLTFSKQNLLRALVIQVFLMHHAKLTKDFVAEMLCDLETNLLSVSRYLWNTILESPEKDFTPDNYRKIRENIPEAVAKNTYGLPVSGKADLNMLGTAPRTRWQWFNFTWAADSNLTVRDEAKVLAEKIMRSDVSLWKKYKKASDIQGPYSLRKLSMLYSYILAAKNYRQKYKGNKFKIEFFPVEGTAEEMLEAAKKNYMAHQQIRIKEIESCGDYALPQPTLPLPKSLEKLRLKTRNELEVAKLRSFSALGTAGFSFVSLRDEEKYFFLCDAKKQLAACVDRCNFKVLPTPRLAAAPRKKKKFREKIKKLLRPLQKKTRVSSVFYEDTRDR